MWMNNSLFKNVLLLDVNNIYFVFLIISNFLINILIYKFLVFCMIIFLEIFGIRFCFKKFVYI